MKKHCWHFTSGHARMFICCKCREKLFFSRPEMPEYGCSVDRKCEDKKGMTETAKAYKESDED